MLVYQRVPSGKLTYNITMENHHAINGYINQGTITQWPFSIANGESLPEGKPHEFGISMGASSNFS